MYKGTVYFIFNAHCISLIFLFSLKFNFCDNHIETPGLPIPRFKHRPPLQPQAYSFLWSRAPSPLFFCPAFFSIKTLIPFRSSIRLNPFVFLSALLSGSIHSSSFPLFYPAQSIRLPFHSFIQLNPVVFLFAYPAQSSCLPFRSSSWLNPVVFISALLSGSIHSYSFPLFYPAQSVRLPFRSSTRLNPVIFLSVLLSGSIHSSSFLLFYPAQSSHLPFRLCGSIQLSSFPLL